VRQIVRQWAIKPIQLWLPFLGPSINFEDVGRECIGDFSEALCRCSHSPRFLTPRRRIWRASSEALIEHLGLSSITLCFGDGLHLRRRLGELFHELLHHRAARFHAVYEADALPDPIGH
jgi:hypothetical protein